MKIHEYQAKEIFRRYGIPVPKGNPAFRPDEAERVAEGLVKEIGNDTVVVKAQIHAGGRGKGGGVKVVKGARAARDVAESLLGKKLVTVQTGPAGQIVRRLLVEQGLDIAKEYYVGMVIDRDARRVALMVSSEGGVEIEEVARTHPEKILRESIDPAVGLASYQARNVAFGLGLSGPAVRQTVKLLQAMARLFVEED
ncbi:MAG: ATP-grasp domain-containing protein, partial [Planctomycetota bacterium]